MIGMDFWINRRVLLDQWISFAQDRWYLIVAAIIVLFIVIGIVKTVIKWLVVLVVVGALIVYGASYKDKIKGYWDKRGIPGW